MKLFFLVMALFLTAQLYAQDQRIKKEDLDELASRMTGIFNSGQQAAKDTSYAIIILHIKPIWKNKTDGYWFYVEQAAAQTLEKPYRQRVYHIYKQDNYTIINKVYEIKYPDQYIGAWKDDNKIYELTDDVLIDRQQCAILLHKNKDGDYKGSTTGKECGSSMLGAAYATSEVSIYKDQLISWDRGWNAGGKQVWGAEKGGYVFIKSKD
jgi:hypothetical protein